LDYRILSLIFKHKGIEAIKGTQLLLNNYLVILLDIDLIYEKKEYDFN